jgi:hypothetical protein
MNERERATAAMTCFAPVTAETKTVGPIGSCRGEPIDGQSLLNGKSGGCAVKSIIGITALALVACSTAPPAQLGEAATQTPATPQDQPAPVADAGAPSDGLGDLDAMTFGCAKAGLNAAAREAAQVPSQGTYQFSYFRIISDSHHSSYEVHFKSNYQGEPELKYCVAIYCQQGWDPKTTQPSVRLMSNEPRSTGVSAQRDSCRSQHAPAKRRS